jgi:hypothetical protein
MLETRFADDLGGGIDSDVDGDDAGVAGAETRRRLGLLNDARSNAAGLLRYFERRAAGTLTALG